MIQNNQMQSSVLQKTPYNPPKKRMVQNHSQPRKATQQPIFTQLDHE